MGQRLLTALGAVVDSAAVDGVTPQTAPADVAAPAAVTTSAVTSAAATTPANVAYTQADQTAMADLVNELKTKLNLAVADIATLRAEVLALTNKQNATFDSVVLAGVFT